VRDPKGNYATVDFRETAPALANETMFSNNTDHAYYYCPVVLSIADIGPFIFPMGAYHPHFFCLCPTYQQPRQQSAGLP